MEKDTKPNKTLRFCSRFCSSTDWKKTPGSVLFSKIKPFLLYANDSVPPQNDMDPEQQHMLRLGTEAYM